VKKVKLLHLVKDISLRYKIQKINSMKKLVYVFVAIGLSSFSIMAQDAGDKKVKLGIVGTPAVNWLTPGNTNTMSGNGATIKAGIGIAADFRLTDVIWLHTGLEYTGTGGKLSYKSTDTVGYWYGGGNIEKVSLNNTPAAGSVAYRLINRNYKAGFVHIPIGFRLKTKEINMLTYFGQIGGDLYVKTSANGNDNVSNNLSTNTTITLTNNALNSVVNFFNAGVHIGAGAEYRFSGSTCLIGSITYQRGLLNYTSVGTDYLTQVNYTKGYANAPTFSQFNNASKISQIVLSLGIMF
jgi:outer membrane protein with beta-barrel domain